MKKALFILGSIGAVGAATPAKADTILTVTNGTGSYSSNYLAFYDANRTYLVLDGVHSIATVTYPDQTMLTFPYNQTVSGFSVTGSWSGADEWGYIYTASVQETLVQKRVTSGSGRGGVRSWLVTYVAGGVITYDYAGANAPPLVAPLVTWNSTQTSLTLFWTAASGGVPPYICSVYDQNGTDVADTADLMATIAGLALATSYTFTVVTTDRAGRQIMSAPASVSTLGPTLNTVYTFDPTNNTVTATWTADPYAVSRAVSYSLFYYDWFLGVWVDGADTTGTSATVSGWSPNTYISFYIAAYDANGVETDYDQQLVSVQPPLPPPGDE